MGHYEDTKAMLKYEVFVIYFVIVPELFLQSQCGIISTKLRKMYNFCIWEWVLLIEWPGISLVTDTWLTSSYKPWLVFKIILKVGNLRRIATIYLFNLSAPDGSQIFHITNYFRY